MTALGYCFYLILIVALALLAWSQHIAIGGLYILIALILFGAAIVRWFIAVQDGTIYHDWKKVEQIDNSVTKPAEFKHRFIYNDCSPKTLFFLELPYILSIVILLILRFCGME